jgi:hypothetical protein
MNTMKKLLPGVALVFALLVDRTNLVGASIVPVICVLMMLCFAFFLSYRQTIVWTVIYVLAIIVTLWMKREMWGEGTGNIEALAITRSLVATIAGVLACLVAKLRERGDDTQKAIYRLLGLVKIPVLASNQDGCLLYMNPEAERLFGGRLSLQTPFFEFFTGNSGKGAAIRNYVDLASGISDGPISIELAISPDPSQIHSAIMLRLHVGDHRQVITLLTSQSPKSPVEPNDSK